MSGRHMEGGGSALPCRVVLAAIRTGSQRCQVLTAVNAAGSSRALVEVVVIGQIIGREAAAGCQAVSREVAARLEVHLSALPDAKLTAVNSLALVRKSGRSNLAAAVDQLHPRLDTISSLAALCSSGPA